ncbi:MAG: TIM44-like domain-containing protein [Candidatus Falkowbacteria bacterium]
MKKYILILLVVILLVPMLVFARAGGGGSSSGGGGHSSSGSGHSSSGGSSGNSAPANPIVVFIFIGAIFMILIATFRWMAIQQKKRRAETEKKLTAAATGDKLWDKDMLIKHASEVFYSFQKDWSNFDVASMKLYLHPDYYPKMVLEMNALQNIGRINEMSDVIINQIEVNEVDDETNNNQDKFSVLITASAHDKLFSTKENKELYTDTSSFNEEWFFARHNNQWLLSAIGQETAEASLAEGPIAQFAAENKFYYDADFGWLMMPNRGAIFHQTNFMVSDINNHVIGYYRDKIVEFYTYRPNPNMQNTPNYLVAQAILPKSYNDILLVKKKFLMNWKPKGLQVIQTEWGDFNDKFLLYADKIDGATSFELLTTNFMAKIYDLPFNLNIEVVDNVLYIYTSDRSQLDYGKLLEILSWAFDEMKM